MHRGLSVYIDLDAASHNLETLRKKAGGLPVIAVVKADAYGHGAVELSRTFIKGGVHSLAVAFISEACQLREAGIKAPVLVLFDATDPEAIIEHSLTPVIHGIRDANALSHAAQKHNVTVGVHLKLNTGMNRMGFENADELLKTLDLPGLRIQGLMSHFADADLADRSFTLEQIGRFQEAINILGERGIAPMCHIANSAASLMVPEARFDALRPGIALYGASPFADDHMGLKPVMRVSARVLKIRRVKKGETVSYGRTFKAKEETIVAVLAAGYADGFPRALSNRAEVIINGKLAPIAGRICMDLTMVDITGMNGVEEGHDAVIMGSDRAASITSWELARRADTIPYEILTGFGRVSARQYS